MTRGGVLRTPTKAEEPKGSPVIPASGRYVLHDRSCIEDQRIRSASHCLVERKMWLRHWIPGKGGSKGVGISFAMSAFGWNTLAQERQCMT